MSDHQVTLLAAALSTGGPILAVLLGVLVNNRQIDSLRREMEARFDALEKIFTERLFRVEQVVDARLSHLEEKLP